MNHVLLVTISDGVMSLESIVETMLTSTDDSILGKLERTIYVCFDDGALYTGEVLSIPCEAPPSDICNMLGKDASNNSIIMKFHGYKMYSQSKWCILPKSKTHLILTSFYNENL